MSRWTFEPGHTAAEFSARHMGVRSRLAGGVPGRGRDRRARPKLEQRQGAAFARVSRDNLDLLLSGPRAGGGWYA